MTLNLEQELIEINKQIDTRYADKFYADSWEQSTQIGEKIDKLEIQKKDLLLKLDSKIKIMLKEVDLAIELRKELVEGLKVKIISTVISDERLTIITIIVKAEEDLKQLKQKKEDLLSKNAHDKSIP